MTLICLEWQTIEGESPVQSTIIFIEPGRATYVARAGEVLEVKMSRMRDNLSEDRGTIL